MSGATGSGYRTELYSEALNDSACVLVGTIDAMMSGTGSSYQPGDFKIVSYDLCPVSAYFQSEEGINYQLQKVEEDLGQNYSSYLSTIKVINDERVDYEVLPKLPEDIPFDIVDDVEEAAIAAQLAQILLANYAENRDNITAELSGFDHFQVFCQPSENSLIESIT